MIQVKFTTNSDKLFVKLHVSGHSGYEEIGKDIVCSGVTTAVYTTIGLIEKLSKGFLVDTNEEKAVIQLTLVKPDDLTQTIMQNVYDILSSIAFDYPKHVKISNILK
jgi:uncharacterized protein